MRTKITTIAAAGVLGVGVAALGAPTIAAAATGTSTESSSVAGRLAGIKDALKGLVSDGTITQEQADKVATTLEEKLPQRGRDGFGGRGFGRGLDHAVAADALGLSEADLRTQLQAGTSLADIAAAKDVDKTVLIDKLVAAAEKRLTEAVTAGRLTQAQADAAKADLRDHVARHVEQAGLPGRGGRGPGGRHG